MSFTNITSDLDGCTGTNSLVMLLVLLVSYHKVNCCFNGVGCSSAVAETR